MLNHRKIVGNEHIAQIQLALQPLQKVNHLGLHGNVQGRNGFVAHDEPGRGGQGPGDADALALTAGEGVGIPLQMPGVQTHQIQQLLHPFGNFRAGQVGIIPQRFADNVPNNHAGIQGRIGILKNHLHIPAGLPQLIFV